MNTRRCARFIRLLPLLFWITAVRTESAESARVLPPGQIPQDARLEPLKDLDGYFPFTPPASTAEWAARAEQARKQIRVALGLWPMPTRTPLHAVIHGRIDRGDYTVEKVYFESLPGFFVTGNLYRPKRPGSRRPGVLCPHGHWPAGRFVDQGEEAVRLEIANGAERFEQGGRSVLQARCVGLVRMGCVVFHYDMIGYADSVQLSPELAHRFAVQRPEMNTRENWGLFSPQAEAHLQSVMGLQTWNSIRALDFLLSLPEVDPERIGCTGASGGGTQTFILGAIDPRVKVSFPAVMVGTAMQGGCTCENASLLRIGTGNVEFAALFAPKPLGLTSANDWTREMSTKGFPQLKQIYALLGSPEKVSLKRAEHFGHNYNSVSRTAMYSWMNRWFGLGLKEPVLEADYRRLIRAEMSVWDADHPAPQAADPEFERSLLRSLDEDAHRQLAAAQVSPGPFRKAYGEGLEVVIGRTLETAGEVAWEMTHKEDRGTWLEMSGLLRNKTHSEVLPAVFCHPKQWNGTTVLWLTGLGKAGLRAEDGSLRPEVERLINSGATVLGVDLFDQGEFLTAGEPVTPTRRVKNPREAAAFTFGYNPALFACRVHDVLSVVKFVRSHERPSKRLDVIGLEGAGPWVAAARALSGEAIDRAAIDTRGFRFGDVLDLRSPDFLPGGAKYGDLPGMLALSAPGWLWVAGETEAGWGLVRAQYANANADARLTVFEGPAAEKMPALIGRLLE